MRSRVTSMTGVLPANLQIAMLRPSILNLGSDTGQTDDGHQRFMPHTMEVGHKKLRRQLLTALGSYLVASAQLIMPPP